MTVVHNANIFATRRCDLFAADGVCLSTELHPGATVIVVTGELDAANIHHLAQYAGRRLSDARSLILDLSGLDFLAAQGIRVLYELDRECDRRKTGWALVPGHPVTRLLRVCDKDAHLPSVSSIGEALERFSRVAQARKLLQLVTKSG
jgi:anti-anti-sigma factor